MTAKPVVLRELADRDIDEAIAHYLGEAGARVAVRFINGVDANTGAATLGVDGLGAVPIRRGDGTVDLDAGDVPASALITVVHDGTVFRLA